MSKVTPLTWTLNAHHFSSFKTLKIAGGDGVGVYVFSASRAVSFQFINDPLRHSVYAKQHSFIRYWFP